MRFFIIIVLCFLAEIYKVPTPSRFWFCVITIGLTIAVVQDIKELLRKG